MEEADGAVQPLVRRPFGRVLGVVGAEGILLAELLVFARTQNAAIPGSMQRVIGEAACLRGLVEVHERPLLMQDGRRALLETEGDHAGTERRGADFAFGKPCPRGPSLVRGESLLLVRHDADEVVSQRFIAELEQGAPATGGDFSRHGFGASLPQTVGAAG